MAIALDRLLESPAPQVAPLLLGCVLCRTIDGVTYRATIVETEAYDQTDPACHGYQRQTERNKAIFGKAGTIYVYRICGIHFCLNVVCDRENYCSAVLVRAVSMTSLPPEYAQYPKPHRIGAGPAKLCQLLRIDLNLNGAELNPQSGIWLEPALPPPSHAIIQTTRIGITKGVDIPWRWYLAGHPAVSKK